MGGGDGDGDGDGNNMNKTLLWRGPFHRLTRAAGRPKRGRQDQKILG